MFYSPNQRLEFAVKHNVDDYCYGSEQLVIELAQVMHWQPLIRPGFLMALCICS